MKVDVGTTRSKTSLRNNSVSSSRRPSGDPTTAFSLALKLSKQQSGSAKKIWAFLCWFSTDSRSKSASSQGYLPQGSNNFLHNCPIAVKRVLRVARNLAWGRSKTVPYMPTKGPQAATWTVSNTMLVRKDKALVAGFKAWAARWIASGSSFSICPSHFSQAHCCQLMKASRNHWRGSCQCCWQNVPETWIFPSFRAYGAVLGQAASRAWPCSCVDACHADLAHGLSQNQALGHHCRQTGGQYQPNVEGPWLTDFLALALLLSLPSQLELCSGPLVGRWGCPENHTHNPGKSTWQPMPLLVSSMGWSIQAFKPSNSSRPWQKSRTNALQMQVTTYISLSHTFTTQRLGQWHSKKQLVSQEPTWPVAHEKNLCTHAKVTEVPSRQIKTFLCHSQYASLDVFAMTPTMCQDICSKWKTTSMNFKEYLKILFKSKKYQKNNKSIFQEYSFKKRIFQTIF